MIIEGLRKEKTKQIEYVFRNWLKWIGIVETRDDPGLYKVQFSKDYPFTLEYSSSRDTVIIELGEKYIFLDTSDFVTITLF